MSRSCHRADWDPFRIGPVAIRSSSISFCTPRSVCRYCSRYWARGGLVAETRTRQAQLIVRLGQQRVRRTARSKAARASAYCERSMAIRPATRFAVA